MQNTIDTMLRKLRSAANTASKKTNEIVGISRLKLQIISHNNEIEKLYKRIGSLVYESSKNGADYAPAISESIAQIDAHIAQIQALNIRLDDIRAEGHSVAYDVPMEEEYETDPEPELSVPAAQPFEMSAAETAEEQAL